MAKIYQTYRLKYIPEFRLEVEDEHTFKFLNGQSEAKWFINDKVYGHHYYSDVKEYNDRMRQFFSSIDKKISVSAKIYRIMDNLIKDGTANAFFKEIYNHNVIFTSPFIVFKGMYESKFWQSSIAGDGFCFVLKSTYPHKKSYSKNYNVLDGIALKNLLTLFLLMQIKEMPFSVAGRDITRINDSYIKVDILKKARAYNLLEINLNDGSIQSISDIL